MVLRLVASESAFDYFRATRAYLQTHGKSAAFYSDKHNIVRVKNGDGGEPSPASAVRFCRSWDTCCALLLTGGNVLGIEGPSALLAMAMTPAWLIGDQAK